MTVRERVALIAPPRRSATDTPALLLAPEQQKQQRLYAILSMLRHMATQHASTVGNGRATLD